MCDLDIAVYALPQACIHVHIYISKTSCVTLIHNWMKTLGGCMDMYNIICS